MDNNVYQLIIIACCLLFAYIINRCIFKYKQNEKNATQKIHDEIQNIKFRKIIKNDDNYELSLYDRTQLTIYTKLLTIETCNETSNDIKKFNTPDELCHYIWKQLHLSLMKIKYVPCNVSEPLKHKKINEPLDTIRSMLNTYKQMSICICDGILYGSNAGNLVRKAGAFGFDAVFFCPPNATSYEFMSRDRSDDLRKKSVYSTKDGIMYNGTFITDIKRFSMAAENSSDTDVIFNYQLHEIYDILKELGYRICVMENDSTGSFLHNTDISDDRIAFIIGNERVGVSSETRGLVNGKLIDLITIKTSGIFSSLNASDAGLLVFSERSKQLDFKHNNKSKAQYLTKNTTN